MKGDHWFFLDLLKCCWCLGLISADYEQWEEDGEQGATWWKKTAAKNTISDTITRSNMQ